MTIRCKRTDLVLWKIFYQYLEKNNNWQLLFFSRYPVDIQTLSWAKEWSKNAPNKDKQSLMSLLSFLGNYYTSRMWHTTQLKMRATNTSLMSETCGVECSRPACSCDVQQVWGLEPFPPTILIRSISFAPVVYSQVWLLSLKSTDWIDLYVSEAAFSAARDTAECLAGIKFFWFWSEYFHFEFHKCCNTLCSLVPILFMPANCFDIALWMKQACNLSFFGPVTRNISPVSAISIISADWIFFWSGIEVNWYT